MDTPVRKTRMGGTVSTAPPEQTTTPARKTRMGSAGSAAAETTPVAKTRMGAAPDSQTPSRTRMGGVTPAPATQDVTTTRVREEATPSLPQEKEASSAGERPAWVRSAMIIFAVVVGATVVVLGARGLRTLDGVQEFITTYDGHATQPESAPVGIPAWLGWQHFLNMFFIVLIIRTGLAVRSERKPPAYWTARENSFFSPPGNVPKKVSLSQWLHQALDVLWVLNGMVFIVLLAITGHWMRIVPMSWDIFPNMLSALIQYASLDWPAENGWIHYNALQVMAYFITVFIAAPLAVVSGLRFSTWWPENAERLNKLYPVEVARVIHFPVMLYFVAFTIVHVFLVFFTGALTNLNHMYTSRDVADWWGLIIFLASVAVITGAWFLTKPLFITPIARLTGSVTKN